MSADALTLDMEFRPTLPEPIGLPGAGLAARIGRALMRRVREAAWAVLDLHTEFEAVD